MAHTSRSTSRPHKQIHIVHAEIQHHIAKVATSTMLHKGTGYYMYVLQVLKRGVPQVTGYHWRPTTAIDFEHAAKNAFQTKYQNEDKRNAVSISTRLCESTWKTWGLPVLTRTISALRSWWRKSWIWGFYNFLMSESRGRPFRTSVFIWVSKDQ